MQLFTFTKLISFVPYSVFLFLEEAWSNLTMLWVQNAVVTIESLYICPRNHRLKQSARLSCINETFIIFCFQPYRVPCHITHLSSAQALPIIKKARQKGAPITVETTHHYLSLSSESIPPGGTYFKCCPPIREKSNQVRNVHEIPGKLGKQDVEESISAQRTHTKHVT